MNEIALRKLIREIIEEELLDEVSTSADAGPYMSKLAFRGNKSAAKEKAKEIATQAGYSLVDRDKDEAEEPGDTTMTVPYGKKGTGALKKPETKKPVIMKDWIEK